MSGVLDTGKQFFRGIVDTGDKFWLFGYFWPVSTTLGKDTGDKLFSGVHDTGDKLYWWQGSALAAKLSPAAEVGHGNRYCHWNSHENAQRHLTNPDQGRQSYFKPKRHYLVLAASGASDQDVWGVFDATFHGGSNETIGGRGRYRWFITFNFLLSLAAPHLHGVLVLVTGNKFNALVVVTGDNCSLVSLSPATKLLPVSLSPATKLLPVSLSPVINCSPVSTTPGITENPWQRLIAGVNDTGNKFFADVIDTAEQFYHRW
jgi:hypothetical protein